MAKKRIDNIAKHKQQPRGPPPKRRTDFSIFLCSSFASEASSDAFAGSSSYARDGLSNVATTGLNKVYHLRKGPSGSTLLPCSNQPDMRTQPSDGHLTGTDLVDLDEHAESASNWDLSAGTREHEDLQILESQATTSTGGCMTPCLNGREADTADGSQDSSKHVSNEKDRVGFRRQLFKSPDKKNISNQQQQSSGRMTSSNSTELEDESSERGRGKRKRKPKLHFDEESNLPLKSARKVRRFRIMRYLGLMAPVGSPF
ncbi:uncharacterized protein LOC116194139 [Punica granatum]|uniref:Uncharacterized protein LOC116194139 n=2 Tax=Punica granatum TaxID=22663 RepID=A0A6P8C771_PUNGR|nr:uncharacterized protein LOC116194139 [Punica granatum]XP_031378731.1 uncharacterized protein LOC116194139 [Punica granatum]OWM69678.1 hypothetical protein CDL15_Pgr025527 [Punica granatum]PKI57633.1 hypothetical protein CRG98_021961 [Punica granatum]